MLDAKFFNPKELSLPQTPLLFLCLQRDPPHTQHHQPNQTPQIMEDGNK
jgi:hypothetical protein